MLGQLKSKLKASSSFPSPPAIAQQIIALARDPDTDISQVAAAISRDPALAAKLLRVANSALYSRQRKSANLRQALIVLGLQGATTLALGFSLIGTYMGLKSNGVDYDRYWRRAILSASAARCFGDAAERKRGGRHFPRGPAARYRDPRHRSRRAGFLSRPAPGTPLIGSLRATKPPALESITPSSVHGCWRTGSCPSRSVARSRGAMRRRSRIDRLRRRWRRAVLHSAASAWRYCSRPQLRPTLRRLVEHASQWLGIDAPAVAEVMGKLIAEIPEIERLFDTELLQPDAASAILDQARDLLILRNLEAIGQVSSLGATNLQLEARAAALQDQRRDRLTEVYNRGYLDVMLRREFQAATTGNWPLSLVFVDLDRFKEINETHGREAGDSVLVTTAKSIAAVARDTDCVARYGGTRVRDRAAGSGVTRCGDLLRASDHPPARHLAHHRRHGGDRDRLGGARHPRSAEAVSTRLGLDQCR